MTGEGTMERVREQAISLAMGMLAAASFVLIMAAANVAHAQPQSEIYPQKIGEREALKLADAYKKGFKELRKNYDISASCSYNEHPEGNRPPMECSVTFRGKTPRETEDFKQLMRGGSAVLLEKYGQRVWASAVFEDARGRGPIESYWYDPFWGFQYQTFWP